MFAARFKFLPVVVLVLGCHAPEAFAHKAPSVAERLHDKALSSFRQARFPEAYGRFIALADAGHAPSAKMALWMYEHGMSVFGKDWDSTQEQLDSWVGLASAGCANAGHGQPCANAAVRPRSTWQPTGADHRRPARGQRPAAP